jgi:hypothetical protein
LVLAGPFSGVAAAADAAHANSSDASEPEATEAEARRLSKEGLSAFGARDYASALTKFSEAYALSPVPGLLYNMAQAQRLLGDCRAAVLLYRRFLAANPEGKPRTRAERRIQELGDCSSTPPSSTSRLDVGVQASEPSQTKTLPSPLAPVRIFRAISDTKKQPKPPPRIPAERSSTGSTVRIASIVSFASGAALLGMGSYFGWRASRASADVSAVFEQRGSWSDALEQQERAGKRDETRSVTSLAAGLLAAGVGICLVTFD